MRRFPKPVSGKATMPSHALARIVLLGTALAVPLTLADPTLAASPASPSPSSVVRSTAWMPRQPSTSPPPQSYSSMSYDAARHRTVLFNGDTWEWDGTTWSEKAPATSPSPRSYTEMAYDRASRRTVLFGGGSDAGTNLNDTWAWDGTTWTELHPATSPAPRALMEMAYDPVNRGIVLFGGIGGVGPYGTPLYDTWLWQGSNWTERHPTKHPATLPGEFAYDPGTKSDVMFGGSLYGTLDTTVGETWEWKGTDWTQRAVVGPQARSSNPLAFDERRHVLVMFGGYHDRFTILGDTWEWNGKRWIQNLPATAPPARTAASMAEDPLGGVVLFGGGPLNDTWTYPTNRKLQ